MSYLNENDHWEDCPDDDTSEIYKHCCGECALFKKTKGYIKGQCEETGESLMPYHPSCPDFIP